MYAIIETGGKQYKVSEGDVLFIEKLAVEADEVVTFDKVVLIGSEDGVKFGAPTVANAEVTAKVLKNGKSKKITVFTYKAKKGSKRKMGHRQPYTKVEITGINESAAPKAEGETAKKKPATKKAAAPKAEGEAKKPATKKTAKKEVSE